MTATPDAPTSTTHRTTSGLDHRSYSQYKTFTECGEKYRLERVVGAKGVPAVWFAAGTALHAVAEQLDAWIYYQGMSQPAWSVGDAFLEEFDNEITADEEASGLSRYSFRSGRGWGYDRWAEQGPVIAADYSDWRLNREGKDLDPVADDNGHPVIEYNMAPVFGGVTVTTIPDKVAVNAKTGELLVIDYKSGATKPEDGGLQLGAQATAVKQTLGLEVEWGSYYMFREGRLTPPRRLTGWTEDRLGQIFAAFDKAEKAGIYMPRLSKDCDRCDVRKWCVYQGGDRHPNDKE